jgi:hypothetical protein
MDENETTPVPERNLHTQAAHRREVLWQITIPFIFVTILLLAVAVFASLSGPAPASLFGDIALIWLILPLLVVLLVFTGILTGLVYLLVKANQALPGAAFKAQNLVIVVKDKLTTAADMAAKPVFKVEGIRATLKAIIGR